MAPHHPATDRSTEELTPDDVDELVELLTAEDDDLRCNGISEAQAAAVVRRDLAGQTRGDVSNELGISISTVDKRTYGGRDHVTLAARTALAAHETGVLDALVDSDDAIEGLVDVLDAAPDVDLSECEVCGEEFVSVHGVSTHDPEDAHLVMTCGRRDCLREVYSCDLCDRWADAMNRHESGLCVPCASLQLSEGEEPGDDEERTLADLWADFARLDAAKKVLPDDESGSVIVEDADPATYNRIQDLVDDTPGVEIWKALERGKNVRQIVIRPPEADDEDVEPVHEDDVDADTKLGALRFERDVETALSRGGIFTVGDLADAHSTEVAGLDAGEFEISNSKGSALVDHARELLGRDDVEEDVEEDDEEPATDDRGVEATDDLPEPFATLTPKKSGNEDAKRRAIYAAANYVSQHDDVRAGDLKIDVYPDNQAGYGSARSWWENLARDGLKDVGAVVEGQSWTIDEDVLAE